MVRTSPFNGRCVGSIPGCRTKIPYALQPKNKQTNKTENRISIVTNSIKTLKNGPHQKNLKKKITHTFPRSWIVLA